MQWIGLPCVIVVVPDHTHLLSKLDNFRSVSMLSHCFGMYCAVSFVVSQSY